MLVIIAGALLIALCCAKAFGAIGKPGYFPIKTTFPFPWVLVGDSLSASILSTVLYCIWCGPLWRGEAIPRKRTAIAALIVGCVSAAWYLAGVRYGLRYQGLRYLITTASGSFALAAVIAALLIRSWRRQNPVSYSLAATVLLFIWSVTYALPWLGDYP